MQTLFDRLGGAPALEAVVGKFYEFMLNDNELKKFFENTDVAKQIKSQVTFLTMVTGGPNHYHGLDMKAAHATMKINLGHFNATWKHLLSALECFKVGTALIEEVKDIFYSVQADIVNS